MAGIDTGEEDWREIMASKASKWNKRSRRLSHLTISTHSRKRSRSPEDVMGDVELDDSGWSETESTVSTGFSRSVGSRGTALSVYSGLSCDSREDLDLDGRESSIITVDDDDDVSTTSEVPESFDELFASAPTSAQPKKWIEDDSGIRVFPTKHVDYLSHDWQEVDIWASWRHLMSKKHSYNNEKRLENACWRVWGKKRYDLKTVSPESLNWLKDCDVTWLYGPLQPGVAESLKVLSLEDAPAPLARHRIREEILDLKPILKRRSVSEKMLVRSLLSASLLKQATAAVVAERSVRARSLPLLPLLDKHEYTKSIRLSTPARSRSSSTTSLRPLMTDEAPDKKRIHFQEQVEQCIALENSESESESRGVNSDLESDFEDGAMTERRAPFSRTQRRPGRSVEKRTKIIAKLPSTTLNCIDGDAELVNSRFWSKDSPPLLPSPRSPSPSLSTENFTLEDEDEEYIPGWILNSTQGLEDSEKLPMKGNLPFPCLACKDSVNAGAGQGQIFGSRNHWLVHLWTVHQDPSTWTPTACLWEGCESSHKYRTAALWLGHVKTAHRYNREIKQRKAEILEDKNDAFILPDGNDELQGGRELSKRVFSALATAKDIGSFLLHSAGEPLAAHLEWLNSRRAKAGEGVQNEPASVSDPTKTNDTQYFKNLARRILGISTENQTSQHEHQDPDQEALVERLAETLSLYEVETNEETAVLDLDGCSEVTSRSPIEEQKKETARTWALYSMLISIRQSIISINPPSELQAEQSPVDSKIVPEAGASPVCLQTSELDHQQSMVLPIRGAPDEAAKIHSDSEEEETTDYDSNEDIPSDASAYDEPSDGSGEITLNHNDLEPMRQALVDRVMDEFWVIFNQNWNSGCREHARVAQNSTSPSNASVVTSGIATPQSTRPTQRKRQRDDDMGSDDEDGNMSRKPKRSSGPSDDAGDRKRFACPFRKHDSRRYSTYNYRVCALSHWETIARVKEHIYRCHRMPTHCKRCWKSFKTQEQLDTHLTVDIAAICDLVPGNPPEGINTDLERRLRSRKKSSRDQSDEGRWREMYQLLFPGEEVPSPYFEPIQDEMPGSPDSRDLANYEDYMRRELPRLVRTNIEDVVRRDMQPLEAALIGNLVGIIQDCQDRLFRGYRQMRGDGTDASTSPMMDLASVPFSSSLNLHQGLNLMPSGNGNELQQSQLLAAAFQPAPPAASSFDVSIPLRHQPSITNLRPQPSMDMILSDSGYASELPHFCDCPGTECTCSGATNDTRPHAENIFGGSFPFDESAVDITDMQWDGWDPFPTWDSLNPAFGQ